MINLGYKYKNWGRGWKKGSKRSKPVPMRSDPRANTPARPASLFIFKTSTEAKLEIRSFLSLWIMEKYRHSIWNPKNNFFTISSWRNLFNIKYFAVINTKLYSLKSCFNWDGKLPGMFVVLLKRFKLHFSTTKQKSHNL